MKKVLFVCTGNICRSPMAEAFFNHLAGQKQLPMRARSAGLYPVLDFATQEAVIVGREYGVDLSAHRSRRLDRMMAANAGIILTMTSEQQREIERAYPTASGKTFTLLEFAGESGDIADPYGQGLAVYRRCAQQIWAAVEKGVERLKREA
jgi:protein-tyrosine-phosphatase